LADPEDCEAAFKASPPGDRQQEAAEADQTHQNIREYNARLVAEVARLTETVAAQDAFLGFQYADNGRRAADESDGGSSGAQGCPGYFDEFGARNDRS
jgi:hypothetical protein